MTLADGRRRFYVCQNVGVWSLSRESFKRFLQRGCAGEQWNLDDYGRRIKANPRALADARMPCDWSPETFRDVLETYFGGNE